MPRYDATVTTDQPYPWSTYTATLTATNFEAAVGKAAREWRVWFRKNNPGKRLKSNKFTVKVIKTL